MASATKHPLYKRYASMKNRCNNPKKKYYNGRGIKVCERWAKSFWLFLDDMGEPPSADCQIDRIDNDGDYTPENCRWATPKQQQNNRRGNVILEFQGRSQTMQEWCDELGLNKALVRTRLFVYGMSVEEALTRPVREHLNNRKDVVTKNSKPISFNGETHTLNEWARRIGISRPALSTRIKRWGVERALTEGRLHP